MLIYGRFWLNGPARLGDSQGDHRKPVVDNSPRRTNVKPSVQPSESLDLRNFSR